MPPTDAHTVHHSPIPQQLLDRMFAQTPQRHQPVTYAHTSNTVSSTNTSAAQPIADHSAAAASNRAYARTCAASAVCESVSSPGSGSPSSSTMTRR